MTAADLSRRQKAKAVVRAMKRMGRRTWVEPSDSSYGVNYTVMMETDGKLSCDCPRWRNKRPNQPRGCKHIDRIVIFNGLRTRHEGDYQYVENT
jgi:hypothetical protein